jgi:Cu/Ag efflux protein CusF
LSDDPEAIEMKNRILDSAKMFGLKPGDNLNVFFDKMEESIQNLEKTLDK